jgi:hypothetical protein
MSVVEQSKARKALEARLSKTESPRQRHMLEVAIAHVRAEAELDLEGLMASLTEDPQYHFWGNGVDQGPKGAAAVRQYYSDLVEAKRGILEYDIETIVLDDDTLVTIGPICAINRGNVAKARGWDVPESDPNGDYLVSMRATIIWPFSEDGELLGEDSGGGWSPTDFRKLDAAELPEVYVKLFATENA